MATAVANSLAAQFTSQSTTSSTYATVTGASLASGTFTAGRKYLIVAKCKSQSDSGIGLTIGQRLVHGSTPFADSEQQLDTDSVSEWYDYCYVTVWTAVAGEAVSIQHASLNGAATVQTTHATVFALELDASALVEGADWLFDENAGLSEGNVSNVEATALARAGNAEIVIPQPVSAEQWLVISSSTSTTSGSGSNDFIEHRWAIDGVAVNGGTDVFTPLFRREGENSGDDLSVGAIVSVVDVPSTGSKTVEEFAIEVGGVTGQRKRSALFALRLNAFVGYGLTQAFTEESSIVSGWQEAVALDHTPSQTADVWVLCAVRRDCDLAPRLQVDGADSPGNYSTSPAEAGRWDPGDSIYYIEQTVVGDAPGATALDIDFDLDRQNTMRYRDRTLVAIDLAVDAPPLFGAELAVTSTLSTSVERDAAIASAVSALVEMVASFETQSTFQDLAAHVAALVDLAASFESESSISDLAAALDVDVGLLGQFTIDQDFAAALEALAQFAAPSLARSRAFVASITAQGDWTGSVGVRRRVRAALAAAASLDSRLGVDRSVAALLAAPVDVLGRVLAVRAFAGSSEVSVSLLSDVVVQRNLRAEAVVDSTLTVGLTADRSLLVGLTVDAQTAAQVAVEAVLSAQIGAVVGMDVGPLLRVARFAAVMQATSVMAADLQRDPGFVAALRADPEFVSRFVRERSIVGRVVADVGGGAVFATDPAFGAAIEADVAVVAEQLVRLAGLSASLNIPVEVAVSILQESTLRAALEAVTDVSIVVERGASLDAALSAVVDLAAELGRLRPMVASVDALVDLGADIVRRRAIRATLDAVVDLTGDVALGPVFEARVRAMVDLGLDDLDIEAMLRARALGRWRAPTRGRRWTVSGQQGTWRVPISSPVLHVT